MKFPFPSSLGFKFLLELQSHSLGFISNVFLQEIPIQLKILKAFPGFKLSRVLYKIQKCFWALLTDSFASHLIS